jgi:hypothetical protein
MSTLRNLTGFKNLSDLMVLFLLALGLFLDLDHLNAVVRAAVRANVVRQMRLFALRARHKLPGLERQVATAAIAAALLNLSLWKSAHRTNSFQINRFASVCEAVFGPHRIGARHLSRAGRIITEAPRVSRRTRDIEPTN